MYFSVHISSPEPQDGIYSLSLLPHLSYGSSSRGGKVVDVWIVTDCISSLPKLVRLFRYHEPNRTTDRSWRCRWHFGFCGRASRTCGMSCLGSDIRSTRSSNGELLFLLNIQKSTKHENPGKCKDVLSLYLRFSWSRDYSISLLEGRTGWQEHPVLVSQGEGPSALVLIKWLYLQRLYQPQVEIHECCASPTLENCYCARISLKSPQVCVLGYTIIGFALLLFVQAKDVFPQLLLARLFFSIGGAAASTMVTAILPSMIAPRKDNNEANLPNKSSGVSDSHGLSPSISSELTITPQRLIDQPSPRRPPYELSPNRLAGIVGIFTGCGALLALAFFLRLPELIQRSTNASSGQALADSYYIVGALSLALALWCFLGLQDLCGEGAKGWRNLVRGGPDDSRSKVSNLKPLAEAVTLGFKNPLLGLGYLGGFVARASVRTFATIPSPPTQILVENHVFGAIWFVSLRRLSFKIAPLACKLQC